MKILLASHRRLLASVRNRATRNSKDNHFAATAKKSFFSTQEVEEETEAPLESFLNGTSSLYAEQMYEEYLEDPASVQDSWRLYFENEDKAVPYDINDYSKPTTVPGKRLVAMEAGAAPSDSLTISHLIRAYQVNGHEAAQLDPLKLFTEESFPFRPKSQADGYPSNLELEYYGLGEEDLDRKLNFKGRSSGGQRGYLEELAKAPKKLTLRAILEQLRKTYCGTLAVEYMHIGDPDKTNWIRQRIEHPHWMEYDKEKKAHIYERLCFADTFENFMAFKFNTTKRFGLDGGEAVIPGLKDAIDRASELGANSFVLGMPHRGRLNILANVMRKPMPLIFSEFAGTHYSVDEELSDGFSGDVKYHLGSSMDRTYPDGRRIHMSLVANPSHLECVDPLVIGKARAKQYYQGNSAEDVRNCVPILLHGDAAFAGQGVVYETMQLANVEDFAVGGTIHVIVNNQIGFTTNPINSRSTPYCSDLGKAFNCPIFHCNGDDPLAVSTAMEMAVEYRHEWGTDVIIDIVCYRRNGHNELDQPAFTQPKLYKAISRHPTTLQIFEKRLIKEGTMTKEEIDEIKNNVMESYEKDLEASKTHVQSKDDWLASKWAGFKGPTQLSRIRSTGVDIDMLRKIGVTAGTVPDDFKLHRQMKKIFTGRRGQVELGESIDWGTAEALAFGSLLVEGNHVRITGQDVQRGTFSHRHAIVKDQNTEEDYTPLNHISKQMDPSCPKEDMLGPDTQAGFTCRNSILSEFAVVGFELGYSLENPNALVLWEAQFGDFVNGAQIMIDQFISAGEDKWRRQSGLVMLLPHGYDGQGAEHSSCRLERFLQMVDEDPHTVPEFNKDERMQIQKHNWQVVNCTTPANYFHCLRRQIHRDFRKPLIVVSPKNLLRNRRCTSSLEDMGPGTVFKRVIHETDPAISENSENVKKLVFCSGQIYYELLAEREKREITDVALVRIEQIAPFAFDRVAESAAKYCNAEVIWAQQEPKNMGPYSYVNPRIMTATREINGKEMRPRYVGRAVSAAPATGMSLVHQVEYNEILNGVFGPADQ
ncbi:2-oxoglutarate dehydrogenase complex protein [Fragilariopsis cylindrus CCMP1102]|uniref:2-oxoglutarate dehydrogenase, mitochondrial n=1 Tax=Fragilariopsis cylindrus CCMP1102 TaxID=635003 RepID=A0A1E7FW89_9STRA|nr:2-oxoglutarate dehydrogenase complex protein [Fragilariopsis cylindrus CCMP1102]|eukprot:OEU22422.1 2-oxoglutarate dehydrogenase complex protein [Fragilariopsis cylindrus CCMP1102]